MSKLFESCEVRFSGDCIIANGYLPEDEAVEAVNKFMKEEMSSDKTIDLGVLDLNYWCWRFDGSDEGGSYLSSKYKTKGSFPVWELEITFGKREWQK